MKAAYIKKYGKKEKLQIGNLPEPRLLEDDVLIKVHAASVNPIDFKTRDGVLRLFRKYKFPLILGHDLSGEVIAVGTKVKGFAIGDLVFSRPRNGRIGTFSEKMAVNYKEVALKPSSLTHIEAASLPLVFLTSYQVLKDIMKLSPNQKILIQAGSGGIGSIAIQLAKTMEAEVWTTTSSRNIDYVKSLGADHIIDYKKENVFDVVKDLDAVFDTLGGEALMESFKVVKAGGYVTSISGIPDAKNAEKEKFGFIKKTFFHFYARKVSRAAKKYSVNYSFHFMEPNGEQLEELSQLVTSYKVKPCVGKVFSLDQAQDAIEFSESGRARGKIVIEVV